jgi:hypothetical protein
VDIATWAAGLALERDEQAFVGNQVGLHVVTRLTAEDLKNVSLWAFPVQGRESAMLVLMSAARASQLMSHAVG